VKTKRAHEAAASPAAQQALWFELMQFYIREAWLLDERKLKEWLQLFTDDVLYFMPRRKNVLRRELHRELTPLGDLAILEEDKRQLEMRVARLDTDHQLLSGCREDVLRKVNGAWKVAKRTIVLDANVLLDKNLSVFL
jgi:3-phenylpropionate/cinnamic acid dioxygenase small subunit